MDLPKKSRIPTRVRISDEECRCSDKENLPATRKTVQEVKVNKAYGTLKTTAINLNVPTQRHRILSDTALLPSKKITTGVANKLNRVPLGNLDGNLVQDYIQKKAKVTKTVVFKTIETVTQIQQKHEEATRSTKIIKTNQRYETNTYNSKSKQITTYQTLQGTSNERVTLTPVAKAIDLNKAFVLDKKFITVRKPLTPFPKGFVSKDDSDLDEIFVDGPQHFITFNKFENKRKLSELTISPIKSNQCSVKPAVIFQGIPDEVRRPAMKKTLLHKKMQPGLKRGNSAAYCLDIYNTEYLDDIVYYQLREDWKYVLKIDYLQNNNPDITQSRAAVVNWLIKAQDYLNLPQSVLFTTIRLFDRVLGHISVASSMCQLVGLVITWIVHKFENIVEILRPQKLLTLCNSAYSQKAFLKMEKKLLAFFKFDIIIPDVTVYIAYYLKKLRIESDLLLHSAFYILECYALNIAFSTVVPSRQAAAAVRLALKIIHPTSDAWLQLKDSVGYYNDEILDTVMKEMLQQLHRTQDPAGEYREPFKKYAVPDKVQASIVLLRILVAT